MAYVHEYREDEFHPAEIEMLRVKRIPITKNTGKPRWKTKRKGHLLPGDVELLVQLHDEGLSFKTIGERFDMSPAKLQSIYLGFQKRG
jgi:hypothetical protein